MPETSLSTDAELTAHPGSPDSRVRRIVVGVTWRKQERTLDLHYRIEADFDRLRLPARAAPQRADGLWRHTCCEAFLRPAGGCGYHEYNFSPSGQWAAYGFAARRSGMRVLDVSSAPAIRFGHDARRAELQVTLDPGMESGLIELGLAVVVEHDDGSLAWWALSHRAARPDFHDPDSFTLRLDAGQPAVAARP